MALIPVIDQEAYDALNETIKAEYKSNDGGNFILDVTPTNGFELRDTSALQKALGEERTARRAAETAVKAFGDITAEEAREAIQKAKNAKAPKDVDEAVQSALAEARTRHESETKSKDDRITALTRQLETALITSEATKAIVENGGSVDLLLPHVKSSTRMREGDDGKVVVEVLDGNGNARFNAEGNLLSIGEKVGEMKGVDAYAPAFKGTGSAGSGAGSQDSTGANSAGIKTGSADFQKLPPSERLKAARRQG